MVLRALRSAPTIGEPPLASHRQVDTKSLLPKFLGVSSGAGFLIFLRRAWLTVVQLLAAAVNFASGEQIHSRAPYRPHSRMTHCGGLRAGKAGSDNLMRRQMAGQASAHSSVLAARLALC